MAEPAEQPDDVGELTDLDIDSVHAVGKAANGTTILLAKAAAADDQAGLFGADYVRELIAKGADGDAPVREEEKLTPVQAMALVHAASIRKADLSTADVNDLPDSAFAHIETGGKKDNQGKTTPRGLRHYPVHDQAHARNALGRAQAQLKDGDDDGRRIARAALPGIKSAAKKFGIKVAKADGTAGADPGSPEWEGQDAASAQALIDRILAVIPDVNALAQREGAEVGAGHMDDLADVCDLNAVADALMCAAKTLGGFAVSEHAEAGAPVTKAQEAPNTSAAPATPTPQESTVTSTTDGAQPGAANTEAEVAKAAGGMSDAELADFGRLALAKAAAKAAKKKAKASGAAQAPDARVIPGTQTVQSPAQGPDDVMKAQATQFVDAVTQAMAPLAKQLGELAGVVKGQGERVDTLMARPDDRRSPLLNGAIGEPSLAMRGDGPTTTPEFRAVLKAIEEIPDGPARDQAQKGVALAALKARFAPGS